MIITIGFLLLLIVYSMLVLNRTIPEVQYAVGLLIFISLIPVIILFKVATKRKKARRRRDFTPEIKKLVLKRQNYRCNLCPSTLNHYDFDHIESRADNSASNCQALCLDCHREKTIREKRQSKKR